MCGSAPPSLGRGQRADETYDGKEERVGARGRAPPRFQCIFTFDMMHALLVLLALTALALLALLLRHRQREAEEHATRTLTRLRRRHTTFADRTAEISREVAALYSGVARPPAQP